MPEFTVELPEAATVADLLNEMVTHVPDWASLASGTMVAVNTEYAEQSHPLHDGDEVALIPPVSGGAL